MDGDVAVVERVRASEEVGTRSVQLEHQIVDSARRLAKGTMD